MNDYIKNLLIKASRDLKTAEILYNLKTNEEHTESICFHSQQSIEKFLKATLINNEVNFPRTHNLDFLLKKCIEIDESFSGLNVDNITDYAVDIRYAEDFYIPSTEEARVALYKAKQMKDFVLARFLLTDDDLKLFPQ
ncbi:MAG: HEPN domain-containing protein [Ignavibacteriae bacterium]|nr:MAG: HEPN domain-containing protein [Ignavibacteriota bacterium]